MYIYDPTNTDFDSKVSIPRRGIRDLFVAVMWYYESSSILMPVSDIKLFAKVKVRS